MDKKQRNIGDEIEFKPKSKPDPGNGIVEEEGKAYILCGNKKVLLIGGYVRLKLK